MKLTRLMMFLVALVVAAPAMLAEPPAAAAADPAKALTVRTFTFKYKDAEKATGVIKALLSAEGTISIQPGTKSVVVTDRADNLKAVAKAVADFDVPPQPVRLTVRLVSAGRVPAEQAKVGDDLKDIASKLAMFRYNAAETVGQADFEGKEGDPIVADLPTGYRADFKFGEYDAASDSIKVGEFHLSRLQKDQLVSLLKTTLNLRLGQTYIMAATRTPESQRALMIVLVAHR